MVRTPNTTLARPTVTGATVPAAAVVASQPPARTPSAAAIALAAMRLKRLAAPVEGSQRAAPPLLERRGPPAVPIVRIPPPPRPRAAEPPDKGRAAARPTRTAHRVLPKGPHGKVRTARFTKRPSVRALRTGLSLTAAIQGEDRLAIEGFIGRLPTQKLRRQRVVAAVNLLAKENPESIPVVVEAAAESLKRGAFPSPTHLSRRLQRAASFHEKFSPSFKIGGRLLRFYLLADPGDLLRLSQEASWGRVVEIVFDDKGGYRVARAAARPDRDPSDRFSYREAVRVHFLPSPVEWVRRPVEISVGDSAESLRDFFEGVERRHGWGTRGMMRLMQGVPDYYAVRRGETTLNHSFLSDRVLGILGLSETEREKLRHLQAMLRLAQELEKDLDRGPAWNFGLYLRYWRLFYGRTRSEIENAFNEGLSRGETVDISHLELGWFLLRDTGRLMRLAAVLEIPAIFVPQVTVAALQVYGAIDKIAAPFEPRGVATLFPNAGWDLPYFHRDAGDLVTAIGQIVKDRRLARSRAGFARELKVGTQTILSAEQGRGILPEFAKRMIRFLQERGYTHEVPRLRSLWAARQLARFPVPSEGALWPAGRLIRFARFLLVGITEIEAGEGIAERLDTTLSEIAFRFYELGLRPMPREYLQTFTALHVKEGIFTQEEADRFVEHIWKIYEALGVTRGWTSRDR